MPPPHGGIVLVLGRLITEIPPAIDHLLGRAPADAKLQTPAGDQIGGACVLDHVERVFVAHVDDGGAYLDPAGLGADRGQQREGGSELAREVMDAEIGAVRAQFFGSNGKVDGLQKRICGRARLRLRRGSPVSERKEADLFHTGQFNDACADLPPSRGIADPRGATRDRLRRSCPTGRGPCPSWRARPASGRTIPVRRPR